jgi:isoquinoline 1-oxidoreductase subunit beta
LIRAAAEIWQVEAADCSARNHRVRHIPTGRTLEYEQLVDLAARLQVNENPPLKEAGQFDLIGKAAPKANLDKIVSGSALYGADARLPGMLYSCMARPPVYGAQLINYDKEDALAVEGVVEVVEIPGRSGPPFFNSIGGLAAVAKSSWAAIKGRDAIRSSLEWGDSPHGGYETAKFKDKLQQATLGNGRVVRDQGGAVSVLANSSNKISADYHVPHLAHAAMEPPACLADVKDDACEVWAPVQVPQGAQNQLARLLGLDSDRITVHPTLLGGGFGRKSKPDFVLEAAMISRAVKAPVRLFWTRDDDLRHSYYHAISAHHLEASLDSKGKCEAWLHRSCYPSILSTFRNDVTHAATFELTQGMLDLPFQVEAIRCENCEAEAHLRIGWLRSVNNIHHAFAICSFVDELAKRAGRDTRDFLLDLIGEDRQLRPDLISGEEYYGEEAEAFPLQTGRLKNVIRRVGDMAGWAKRKVEPGTGFGLAAHASFHSYVAHVVKITYSPAGKVKLQKVWSVVDCGRIINPDNLRAQVEGAVVFGLSLALYGKISTLNGAVEQSNFHDYPILSMDEMPHIEVGLVENDFAPSGIGEPGVPPVSAALCNAIVDAGGPRFRQLPIYDT